MAKGLRNGDVEDARNVSERVAVEEALKGL
jgi:hypothetical protein